ncbi:LamG domain-containing protein, partial [Actinomadura soli]
MLRSHVQDAVSKGHSTITFGLKAYNESSMSWWKRFADDAYLRVQYNNPPLQPDTDTMFADPGTKCLPSGQAKSVNAVPTVYAYLKDPDAEDKNKVQGQFTLHWANNADGSDWGEKWTSALTPAKTTGSRFEQPLPPTIPQGTKIGWGVRAWDG